MRLNAWMFCMVMGLGVLTSSAAAVAAHADVLATHRRMRETVRRAGIDAAPALIEALEHPDARINLAAAYLITALEPPARPALEACLRHANERVRLVAVRELARRKRLLPFWSMILADEAPAIRLETRLMLLDEHIRPLTGKARAQAIEAFDQAYREGPPTTRLQVVELLNQLLSPGESGWRILERAVADKDGKIRLRASQIVAAPYQERINRLVEAEAWQDLADFLADVDLDAWVDRDLALRVRYRRAQAHHHLGRHDRARAELEAIIAASPQRTPLLLLADTLLALGERDAALQTYLRAVEPIRWETAPPFPFIWSEQFHAAHEAATLLQEAGRHTEAAALLEKVVQQPGEQVYGTPQLLRVHHHRWADSLYFTLCRSLNALDRRNDLIAYYRFMLDNLRSLRDLPGNREARAEIEAKLAVLET